jgi:predicted glutamine amidotransferase
MWKEVDVIHCSNFCQEGLKKKWYFSHNGRYPVRHLNSEPPKQGLISKSTAMISSHVLEDNIKTT